MLVCSPPHLLLHVAGKRLLKQQMVEHKHERPQAQDKQHRQYQLKRVTAPERLWPGRIHQIDNPAGIKDQPRLHHSHNHTTGRQPRQHASEGFDLCPQIRPQSCRRCFFLERRKGIDQVFEKAKHDGLLGSMRSKTAEQTAGNTEYGRDWHNPQDLG